MDMARLSSNNSGVGPETDSPPAYQPGSLEDFNRLYEATYRRLFRTLVTLLRNRAAAEDCVQESYLRAYRAWPTWRPDAPVEAWLHRIAINVAVSHLRRERLREVGELVRRLGVPADPDPTDGAAPELLRELRRPPTADPAGSMAAILIRGVALGAAVSVAVGAAAAALTTSGTVDLGTWEQALIAVVQGCPDAWHGQDRCGGPAGTPAGGQPRNDRPSDPGGPQVGAPVPVGTGRSPTSGPGPQPPPAATPAPPPAGATCGHAPATTPPPPASHPSAARHPAPS